MKRPTSADETESVFLISILPVQNRSVAVASQGPSKWGPPRPTFTERWAFPEATELHSLNFLIDRLWCVYRYAGSLDSNLEVRLGIGGQ